MKNLSVLTTPRNALRRARPFSSFALASCVVVLSVMSTWPGIVMASVQSSENGEPSMSSTAALPASPAGRMALFQQAIQDDLAARPIAARHAYDVLKNSDMAALVAVPSAINLAALGRFDTARQAFDALSASHDPRERDYAHLWQLWLTARTYTGKSPALKKELARMATGMNVSSPSQQALVRLYAGKGSVEAAFAAIAAMPGTDELQRRDALTEATFFTGGYLQFVAHDKKNALQLYEREKNHLNSTSLERPLIDLTAATLQSSNSNFLPLIKPGN